MSKKCVECKNFVVSNYLDVCTVYGESMRYPNKITDCEYFEPKTLTVFDHITESVEMLAEEIVYPYKIRFAYGSEDNWQEYWTSPLIENFYPTRNEAIAATVAELKKEYKENDSGRN